MKTTEKDSGLTIISNRIIKDGNEIPALGIGVKGFGNSMVAVYKVSPSGRIGDIIYRHNMLTGNALTYEDLTRYPVNVIDAVNCYIRGIGKVAKRHAEEIDIPPAYSAEN